MKHMVFISIVIVCVLLIHDRESSEESPAIPVMFPEYSEVIQGVKDTQQALTARYSQAATPSLKAHILEDARKFLMEAIREELLPQWFGTPWDFNGTTEIPREGTIACGYFVTTILRDAGFNVQRAKLAQQASELIIKSLTNEAHIKRFSHASLDTFVASILKWGQGFYLVGLDIHTGFILYDSEGVWFIHASYIEPHIVLKETAQQSPILSSSAYRVLGKLSADETLMAKWLQRQAIPTKTR